MGKFKELAQAQAEKDLEEIEAHFADKNVVEVRTMIAETLIDQVTELLYGLGISMLLGLSDLDEKQSEKVKKMNGDPEKYKSLTIIVEEDNMKILIEAMNSSGVPMVKTEQAKVMEEFMAGDDSKKTLH